MALDPGFALAWSRLSPVRTTLSFNLTRAAEDAGAARQAAERALALVPNRPEAYAVESLAPQRT